MAVTSKYVFHDCNERSNITHDPQVEYALKAVENGGTAVGIRCKDERGSRIEKLVSSKLLKPGANKRIATVDRNIGVVCFPSNTSSNTILT